MYEAIVKKSDYGHDVGFLNKIESRNSIINVAGNAGDEILNNVEVAKLVGEVMDSQSDVALNNYYEPREMINGLPVEFTVNAEWSRNLIGKAPEHTLREGFKP